MLCFGRAHTLSVLLTGFLVAIPLTFFSPSTYLSPSSLLSRLPPCFDFLTMPACQQLSPLLPPTPYLLEPPRLVPAARCSSSLHEQDPPPRRPGCLDDPVFPSSWALPFLPAGWVHPAGEDLSGVIVDCVQMLRRFGGTFDANLRRRQCGQFKRDVQNRRGLVVLCRC